MKIKWDDLKKAVGWLESNTNEQGVTVEFNKITNTFDIKSFDRNNKPVTVKISDDSTGRHVSVISEQVII